MVVYFCFDIVSPYRVALCCYQKRFTFSHEVSLSLLVQVFSCEISLIRLLEVCIQLFFLPILFSGYFCSVDAFVVCIVTGRYNRFSPALLFCSLLVVASVHCCYVEYWQVLFLLLFLTHIVCVRHLLDVRPYASL